MNPATEQSFLTLSKREYIATLIMQGLIANPGVYESGLTLNNQKYNYEKAAVIMADSLLLELSR